MLTEKEEKELSKLSPEFRDKILKVFKSPFYSKYISSISQTNKWDEELISSPSSLFVGEEASNNKEFEYALKYLLSQSDLGKIQDEMLTSMTPEEQETVNKVVTATSLRQEAVGKGK